MRLFNCKGKVWYLSVGLGDMRDSNGRISLISLKDTSQGYGALPEECYELTGKKYQDTLDAIKYFIREGAIPNYCNVLGV